MTTERAPQGADEIQGVAMDEIQGVAILAGNGRLPTEAAARLCRLGAPPLVLAVGPEVDPELPQYARAYHRLPVGQWGRCGGSWWKAGSAGWRSWVRCPR